MTKVMFFAAYTATRWFENYGCFNIYRHKKQPSYPSVQRRFASNNRTGWSFMKGKSPLVWILS